jgi:hypothetical protein
MLGLPLFEIPHANAGSWGQSCRVLLLVNDLPVGTVRSGAVIGQWLTSGACSPLSPPASLRQTAAPRRRPPTRRRGRPCRLVAVQGRCARCAVPSPTLRTGGGRPIRPMATADPFRPLSGSLDGGVTGGAATQRSPFERAGRGRVRNCRPGYAGDRQGQCRQCRHDRNKPFHVHRGPPSRHWRCDRRMEEALFECPACKCMEFGQLN